MEKLDRFENLLTDYAYDELTSGDAVGLKQKFQAFKTDLNHKIHGEYTPESMGSTIQSKGNELLLPRKVFDNAIQTMELLKVLKKTRLPKEQEAIIQNMELNILVLIEQSMNILNKQNNRTRYEH